MPLSGSTVRPRSHRHRPPPPPITGRLGTGGGRHLCRGRGDRRHRDHTPVGRVRQQVAPHFLGTVDGSFGPGHTRSERVPRHVCPVCPASPCPGWRGGGPSPGEPSTPSRADPRRGLRRHGLSPGSGGKHKVSRRETARRPTRPKSRPRLTGGPTHRRPHSTTVRPSSGTVGRPRRRGVRRRPETAESESREPRAERRHTWIKPTGTSLGREYIPHSDVPNPQRRRKESEPPSG